MALGGIVLVVANRPEPASPSLARSATTTIPATAPPTGAPTTSLAPTTARIIPTTEPAAAATASPTTSPGPLAAAAGQTILIDPGHNGQNYAHPDIINRPVDIKTKIITCDTTGTATSSGYTESAYNLDVALRVQAILASAGAHVVMTRTDNNGVGPCINERAAIGNRAHATVGVSIHADGGPVAGRGFHVIYPPDLPGITDGIAANSYRLALDLRAAYQQGTGMPYASYIGTGDGLSERSDLGGLNLSTLPKVFIETGNMQNPTDAALLSTDSFRQHAAIAIAIGLASYLAGR
jgi:N-acetylmuramoyl-L-alanine amidase